MLLAAAIADGCLMACGTWSYFMLDDGCIELPRGLDCYRQIRLPHEGEMCVLRFFLVEHGPNQNRYDLVLVGESGDTILQIDGYCSNRFTEVA